MQQCDSAERALNKLARTFKIEALKRYRSGGEQKVTVEHVHVHKGGQAIVGYVAAAACTAGMAPGVPKGNRNARKHGYYSEESVGRRRFVQALARLCSAPVLAVMNSRSAGGSKLSRSLLVARVNRQERLKAPRSSTAEGGQKFRSVLRHYRQLASRSPLPDCRNISRIAQFGCPEGNQPRGEAS
jgi:hypothetical protein